MGISSGAFVYGSNVILGNEISKVNEVTTNYSILETAVNTNEETQNLTGSETAVVYEKSNYTLILDPDFADLDESTLSMEEAAELGAQFIWDIFECDLEGRTIYMKYYVNPTRAKAYWQGSVIYGDSIVEEASTYDFTIDAITGERVGLFHSLPPVDVYNREEFNYREAQIKWQNNCDEYLEMAAEVAAKHFGTRIVETTFVTADAVYEFYYTADMERVTDLSEVDPEPTLPHYIFLTILATDEMGKQVSVSITTSTHEVIMLNMK